MTNVSGRADSLELVEAQEETAKEEDEEMNEEIDEEIDEEERGDDHDDLYMEDVDVVGERSDFHND